MEHNDNEARMYCSILAFFEPLVRDSASRHYNLTLLVQATGQLPLYVWATHINSPDDVISKQLCARSLVSMRSRNDYTSLRCL